MRADIDLDAGLVTATFTLAEYQEIIDALAAQKPAAPAAPPMFRLPVESSSKPGHFYETRIWFDADGKKHGACQCGDNVYRRNWCKHLIQADRVRCAQHRSAALS